MVANSPDLQQLSCRTHDFDEVVATFFKTKTLTRDVQVAHARRRSAAEPFRYEGAVLGGIGTGRHRPNVSFTVHDAPLDYVVAVTTHGQASYQQAGARHIGAGDQAVIYRPDLDPRVTQLSVGSDTTYLW